MRAIDRWALLGLQEPEDTFEPVGPELCDLLVFALTAANEHDPVLAMLESIDVDLFALGYLLPDHLTPADERLLALSRRVRVAIDLLGQCDRAWAQEQARPAEQAAKKQPAPVVQTSSRMGASQAEVRRTAADEEFLEVTHDLVDTYLEQERLKELIGTLLTFYEERFGVPPPEIVTKVRQTVDRTTLRAWLKLIGTSTADEIAAALRASRAS